MGMQRLTVLLAAAGLLALMAAPVLAQQRVALVIGNATYTHAPPVGQSAQRRYGHQCRPGAPGLRCNEAGKR